MAGRVGLFLVLAGLLFASSCALAGGPRVVAPLKPIVLEAERLELPDAAARATVDREPPSELMDCKAKGHRVVVSGTDATIRGCVSTCPQDFRKVWDCKTFAEYGRGFCVDACWPRANHDSGQGAAHGVDKRSSESLAADGPSFDCSKAARWSEKAVCESALLSNLDRQIAALYSEAKAQLMPLAQGALLTEQKDWLVKRDRCEAKADPTNCLTQVYRSRIDELAGWAGRGPSEKSIAEDRATQATPLPELTSDVVWDENVVPWREECDFGDFECVLEAMRSAGASEQVTAFAQRVEGWAYDFQELGDVDVVSWTQAFAANMIDGQYLVNGFPDLIDLSSYVLTDSDRARPEIGRVLDRLPDGFLANQHFVRQEQVPNGSRFVVQADYVKCNACRNEALARAEIAYDLDGENRFIQAHLLGFQLVGAADTPNPGSAPESAANQPAQVALKDGTQLRGKVGGKRLVFKSSLGDIEIDPYEVTQYEQGRLQLTDGSVFRGEFTSESLEVSGTSGVFVVPAQEVTAINRQPQ